MRSSYAGTSAAGAAGAKTRGSAAVASVARNRRSVMRLKTPIPAKIHQRKGKPRMDTNLHEWVLKLQSIRVNSCPFVVQQETTSRTEVGRGLPTHFNPPGSASARRAI